MKTHPKTVLLIEHTDRLITNWRVVARETTNAGFKRGEMPVIARFDCKHAARKALRHEKGLA